MQVSAGDTDAGAGDTELMVRSDDLDTAAHTAKRHLELGKDYTDYILKVDNHGQLLQTMQCPICEGVI